MLVITGEGSLDEQTLHGKAPAGVAAAAVAAGIPVVAVCGRNLLTADELRAAGITAAYSLLDIEPDPARCMAEAAPLLERLGETIAGNHLVVQTQRPRNSRRDHKNAVTPYAGRELAGRVRRTVLRGVDISADVETNGDRHGRLLRRGEA